MCFRVATVLLCLQVLILGDTAMKRVQAQGYMAQANPAQANRTKTDRSRVPWTLKARPDTCVALHKGQVCFQKIHLSWTGPGGVRLCLFSSGVEQALHCSAADHAIYPYAYESTTSVRFYLRQGESGPVLAETAVNTAWVYRTGRRSSSSWRLF